MIGELTTFIMFLPDQLDLGDVQLVKEFVQIFQKKGSILFFQINYTYPPPLPPSSPPSRANHRPPPA
jgi:hypothetical protein